MEQKKTLWIIAATGAFLLVVLAAAGILYSPARNQSQAIRTTVVYPNDSASNTASGWVNNLEKNEYSYSDSYPATEKKDLVVLADSATIYELAKKSSDDSNASETPSKIYEKSSVDATEANVKDAANTIDLNLLKKELVSEPAQVQPQNINITVNIPSETKTASKSIDSGKKARHEEVKAVQNPIEKTVASAKTFENETKTADENYYVEKKAPVTKNEKVAKSAEPVQKSVAKTSVSKTVKSDKSVNTVKTAEIKEEPKVTQFWVQVASYSNKKGAEGARSVLDENKIPADIFTYVDNKDRMFFRVRVGPYTTKSEAEYWRSKINKIDEFSKAESYITSTRS